MDPDHKSSQLPRVSAIVPLYNKSRTILRSIRSIQCQTLTDIEIIVVDDGSSDDGVSLVESVKDERIKIVRQANSGPGAARNCGLRLAKAEYVAFLDADDEWLPGFLEHALGVMAKNQECAAFVGTYKKVAEGCQPSDTLSQGELGTCQLLRADEAHRADVPFILCRFHSVSTMFKRSVVSNLGGFYDREHASYGEDVYLWIRIALGFSVVHSSYVCGVYHMDDSELGQHSGRRSFPLEPVFLERDAIRRSLPPRALRVFDLWLGIHAIRAGHLQLWCGDYAKLRETLDRVPQTKLWWLQRARLSFKALIPRCAYPYLGLRSVEQLRAGDV
jgi:glycosyltransferase involved in cell wall biosynthesis